VKKPGPSTSTTFVNSAASKGGATTVWAKIWIIIHNAVMPAITLILPVLAECIMGLLQEKL
jgi:hypothetical protein